ncbi:MAG TPA: carbohydrate-binding protein [Clostridiaceae bacterium]|nr:carbohydrate-binding protein [Clostridiaceae bacterium]
MFMSKNFTKKVLSLVIAFSIVAGLFGVTVNPVQAESEPQGESEPITFKRQVGGIFDGMPLFDGNPDHLDAFVETYYDYIGLEGACLYATGIRDNYTFVWDKNPNKGKTIPGGLAAADNVQGVSTDFPAIVGIGQSWNKELAAEIGEVMGSEKISELNVKQGFANIHNGSNPSKPIAFTVLHDLRINPLSGRFDEGYSEDPYMSSIMIDEMAKGLSGITMEESQGGFWQRAVVGTKHYSVYNAQWYRQSANNAASARAIYEYQTRSALRGLASGAVSGVMTSFGRTNGIPNIISPYMIHANKYAKYGLYSSPDFNAENHLYGTSFASEYDESYVPDRKHALALMVLAHSESVRAMGTDKTDVIALVEAVEEGLYGITYEDVKEAGRPLVNTLVRIGVFNEVDENGIPKYYPFARYAKDVANPEDLTNYRTEEHQRVAMQAARESIVLLKNENNALPLSKDEAGVITGIYANARFKTQYSVSRTPSDIPESGMTPLNAIVNTVNNKDNLTYLSGTKEIALKSLANGKYVTAPAGEITDQAPLGKGGQLIADCDENDLSENQYFNVYDWGQEGYSLYTKINNRWVTSPNAGARAVENTNETLLAVPDNTWDNIDIYGASSSLPPVLRNVKNSDGTISIVANAYTTGFGGGGGGSTFDTAFYKIGRFISVDESGKLVTDSRTLSDTSGVADSNNLKFEVKVIKNEGEDVVKLADSKDYAIVFVGANVKHSASEGKDRSTLYMGESDYKLVKNVAEAFKNKGKKTIVVVETNFPVIMEEIQNDPNVDAIVYQPYGGQYDAKALAEVLYGDYAPTGRLTATWYADESALDPIDEYSIPLGNRTLTLDQIDPRYTKDMTNADPIETKLTYMYTEAPVTYPFGYGLSYSSFEYSNLVAPASADADSPFTVSVDVRNKGSVETAEVVQLYVSNPDSAYGEYAPKKKLVSFEKVIIAPGETKTVTLTVDPQDFAVWDVNLGDFTVESGNYNLMIGASSEDIRLNASLRVNGSSIGTLDASSAPINVFDHSYASNDVVYREVSKLRTIESLRADKVVGEYYAVMSKRNGSWVALKNIELTGADRATLSVHAPNPTAGIEIRVDSPDGTLLATATVGEAPPLAIRDVPGCDYQVTEVDYKDVTVDLNTTVEGIHDIYIVFKDANIRIDSIQLHSEADQFTVGEPVFKDAAGNTLTKLVPSADLRASVSITNNGEAARDACLIVALYSADNSVKNISYIEGKVAAGQTYNFNAGFKLPADVTGHYVKVFVWDSISGMRPLSNAVTFE